MWNWKEELLPFVALGAGVWLVIMGWLIARLRKRRGDQVLDRGPDVLDQMANLVSAMHRVERQEFVRASADEQRLLLQRVLVRITSPVKVVLEGTMIGEMLAVTVVSGGERPVELPGPVWTLMVDGCPYLVKLMVVVGDRLDEWNVDQLDQDPLGDATRPETEFRTGVFEYRKGYPDKPERSRYRLTPTTAWVVSGVAEGNAENVVRALQRELNEAQ